MDELKEMLELEQIKRELAEKKYKDLRDLVLKYLKISTQSNSLIIESGTAILEYIKEVA